MKSINYIFLSLILFLTQLSLAQNNQNTLSSQDSDSIKIDYAFVGGGGVWINQVKVIDSSIVTKAYNWYWNPAWVMDSARVKNLFSEFDYLTSKGYDFLCTKEYEFVFYKSPTVSIQDSIGYDYAVVTIWGHQLSKTTNTVTYHYYKQPEKDRTVKVEEAVKDDNASFLKVLRHFNNKGYELMATDVAGGEGFYYMHYIFRRKVKW